ncbi:MAG: hypothetical protein MUF87_09060 [Anaerolineae bacterium]|jgi:hypothetical protein|nr:hypothetical protein [Anaerolineae bacterium]
MEILLVIATAIVMLTLPIVLFVRWSPHRPIRTFFDQPLVFGGDLESIQHRYWSRSALDDEFRA